jgi:hypothetical protein
MTKSEVEELIVWFKSVELPTEPIKIDQCTTIINIKLFLNSHFGTVQQNIGKAIAEPCWNRLLKLKEVLTNK